jgi:phytanoyl-CoA hydroxylase
MNTLSPGPDIDLFDAEVEQFRRDGFFVVRGLAAAGQCDRLRALSREHLAHTIEPIEYEADIRYPGAPESRDASGGRTARRLLQACARDPLYREWATAPAIAGRLRALLGARPMLAQAHHNCVMTKDPRYSSRTGWHQDVRYWSYERPELVSVWLALGREHEDNGCLQVVPGSHAMSFGRERFDDALFFRQDLQENREALAHCIQAELDPGDVLFFHCRLLHAAGWNRTTETKLSLVFTYHAADNRPLANTRSASLPSIALGD